MEADWSVELAADDPVIVVPWAAKDGSCEFVHLRPRLQAEAEEALRPRLQGADQNHNGDQAPDEILNHIEEARREPALRSALLALNSGLSPLWTVKCDAWLTDSTSSEDAPIDLLEMDCGSSSLDEGKFVAGLYIDILPQDAKAGTSFEIQERWIRALVRRLRSEPMHCARTDLVLRRAETWGLAGFGMTWFVQGCGATAERAEQRRAEALRRSLPLVIAEPWP
jgi:hypothetical protein